MSVLWSPQMRKWAKDARYHGIHVGLVKSARTRLVRRDEWGGGGATVSLASGVNNSINVLSSTIPMVGFFAKQWRVM